MVRDYILVASHYLGILERIMADYRMNGIYGSYMVLMNVCAMIIWIDALYRIMAVYAINQEKRQEALHSSGFRPRPESPNGSYYFSESDKETSSIDEEDDRSGQPVVRTNISSNLEHSTECSALLGKFPNFLKAFMLNCLPSNNSGIYSKSMVMAVARPNVRPLLYLKKAIQAKLKQEQGMNRSKAREKRSKTKKPSQIGHLLGLDFRKWAHQDLERLLEKVQQVIESRYDAIREKTPARSYTVKELKENLKALGV